MQGRKSYFFYNYFIDAMTTGKPVVSNIITSKTTGNRVTQIVSSLADSASDLKNIAEKLNSEISFFKDDTEE